MRRRLMAPAMWLMAVVLSAGLLIPVASAQDATPGASPAASPAGSGEVVTSVTREEYQQQLQANFEFEEPQAEGGQLIWADITDIDSLAAALGDDSPTNDILGMIHEGLVGVSPVDGTIVPGLADSYEIAADGITYTFFLNEDATWHDGEDFTADDVAFTIDAYLDPQTNSAYTGIIDQNLASYEVVDENTIRLIAEDQLATFLYDVPGTMFMMAEHIWADVPHADWLTSPGNTGQDPSMVVGTGPFTFVEWVPGDHVTLAKNPNYWDAEAMPHLDEIIFRVLPDENTAVQALIAGEIDWYERLPFSQVETLEQEEDLQVSVYDTLSFNWYAANIENPIFADPVVRQAMLLALDRTLMAEEIYLGFAVQADGTQPVLSPSYAPDQIESVYNYDPEMATQILTDAGWTDSDGDGFLDKDLNEDGEVAASENLRFDFIFTRGVATYDQQVPYMQQAWAEIGIDMLPQAVPFPTLQERTQTGDFDVALFGFNWSPDGGQGIMFRCENAPPNGFNSMRYCNPEYDALDDQMIRTLDTEARIDMQVQLANMVNNDAAAGILVFRQSASGIAGRVHNMFPTGFSQYWSISYAWVDQE